MTFRSQIEPSVKSYECFMFFQNFRLEITLDWWILERQVRRLCHKAPKKHQTRPADVLPNASEALFQYTSRKNRQNSCGQTNNFRSAPNTSFTKNMTQKQKLPTKIKRVSFETVHILRTAEGGSVFPLAVYNSRCYLYGLWRLTGPLPQFPPRAFLCFFVVIVVSFVQQNT